MAQANERKAARAVRPAGATTGREPKRPSWTKRRRARFLAELEATFNVRRSALAAGMSPRSAYDLRQRDGVFRAAWDQAFADGYDRLEAELMARAVGGREGEDSDGFDEGLAMKLLQQRRAGARAVRGGAALKRVSPEDLEKSLVRALAAIARRTT